MFTYVLRRLIYSIPVLLVASFMIFSFVSLSNDPLTEARMLPTTNPRTIQRVMHEKYLDRPIPVRYVYWARDAVFHGFGTTILGDRKIMTDIRRVLPNTLQLVLAAELLTILVAIMVGVYSAIRQYSVFDYAATTFAFLGLAMPVFWFALILQLIFTKVYTTWGIRIFYTAGLSSIDPGHGFHYFIDRVQHLALPVITLVIINFAGYSRFMRASMLEVINSDYVRTARAKGLLERRVIMKHAFRNALIPLATLVAISFGTDFGGAIITETIFALDGMGRYFITNLGIGDPYPVMAWLMITAVMVVIFNLVADLAIGYLDPRIRLD